LKSTTEPSPIVIAILKTKALENMTISSPKRGKLDPMKLHDFAEPANRIGCFSARSVILFRPRTNRASARKDG
jgi:hypothetical protein